MKFSFQKLSVSSNKPHKILLKWTYKFPKISKNSFELPISLMSFLTGKPTMSDNCHLPKTFHLQNSLHFAFRFVSWRWPHENWLFTNRTNVQRNLQGTQSATGWLFLWKNCSDFRNDDSSAWIYDGNSTERKTHSPLHALNFRWDYRMQENRLHWKFLASSCRK